METRTEAGDRHAAEHAARNFTRESYLPLEDAAAAKEEEEEEEEVGFLSPREVLIITLTSITAVILIVIAAVVVILKVSRAHHFYSFALFDAKMHQIRHGQRHGGGQCVQPQHWPRHNYLAVDIILMLCHLETFNQSLPYSSPNFMSVTYEGVSQTFLINIFTLFQR